MPSKDLENQLLSLSPVEKAESIQFLTQSINKNWRGITKNPQIMGGDACIAGTRIPIWLLVSYRDRGINDARILAAYPDLNAGDLVNVWVYAETHSEEIAEAIREQDEADEILDTP
ncbi:MAG: DUF433 domain-containing protein [Limnoraphis robusta]|jgi:uncharacterized protein (DUF433 family)